MGVQNVQTGTSTQVARPVSSLAAAMALHGGPSYSGLLLVSEVLQLATISPEDFTFGPAYANHVEMLTKAREVMRGLLEKM